MTAGAHDGTRRNWKLISLLIAGLCAAVLIGANAHLVYVAVTSQTACVPHAKSVGGDGAYRAAQSAC